jgi:ankyrin repeat protein
MLDRKSDLAKLFVNAVHGGEPDKVDRLLAEVNGLSDAIDQPWCHFDSPPIVASKQNQEMVRALLKHGANINARSDWWAGSFGVLDGVDRESFDFLIANGATPDIHAFANQGMADEVRSCLADDPSSVNARGGDGQTPLHVAASIEVIDVLLSHDADMSIRCLDHSATAAQYAVDQPDLCRHLISAGATPDIFMAAALGDVDLASKIVAKQPDAISTRVGFCPHTSRVHIKADRHIYFWKLNNAETAMEVARNLQHDSMWKFLFDNGTEKDRFLAACWDGDQQTVINLISRSPTITSQLNSHDRKELARAAWLGRTEAVQLMLKAGFDPHLPGVDNSTPLDRACFHGFHEIVTILLERDPEPPLEFKNQFGGTPLSCCIWGSKHSWMKSDVRSDHAKCAELLIAAGSHFEAAWIPTVNAEMDSILKAHL